MYAPISDDKKPNELLLLLCRIKIVFSANENFYAPKEINTGNAYMHGYRYASGLSVCFSGGIKINTNAHLLTSCPVLKNNFREWSQLGKTK